LIGEVSVVSDFPIVIHTCRLLLPPGSLLGRDFKKPDARAGKEGRMAIEKPLTSLIPLTAPITILGPTQTFGYRTLNEPPPSIR